MVADFPSSKPYKKIANKKNEQISVSFFKNSFSLPLIVIGTGITISDLQNKQHQILFIQKIALGSVASIEFPFK